MLGNDTGEPLAGAPAMRTDDVDEAQRVISRYYVPHRLRASSGLNARLNLITSPRLTFGYLAYGTQAELDVPPMIECYHVNLTMRGTTMVRHGHGEIDTTAGLSGVALSPESDSVVRWSADAAQFAVKIPVPVLLEQLSALLQEAADEPPRFELAIDLGSSGASGLLPAARFFAGQLGIGASFDDLLQRQTESYLLTQLLLGTQHTYSARLSSGRSAVGRLALEEAVDYIEAYPEHVVGLAELAAVAGTTATALQSAFQNELGVSVEGYLRGVRLTRIHAEVQSTEAPMDLDILARRWGFHGAPDLVAAYRAQYRDDLRANTARFSGHPADAERPVRRISPE